LVPAVPGDESGRPVVGPRQVNVDKNQELAAHYTVSSIPVFLILKGGQIVANHLGVTSEATLRAELEQFRGS
jgi:thioredoxin